MADDKTEERRTAVAEAVADHFLARGNCRDSLRDIAVSVDSSARMLLHYFDDRDALVRAALEVCRARQLAAANRMITAGNDVATSLGAVWDWYRSAETRRYFALFNDVAALERALDEDSSRQFGHRFESEWRPMFERIFLSDDQYAGRAPELAHLLVATIRGMALERITSSKLKDQKAAYFVLVDLLTAR